VYTLLGSCLGSSLLVVFTARLTKWVASLRRLGLTARTGSTRRVIAQLFYSWVIIIALVSFHDSLTVVAVPQWLVVSLVGSELAGDPPIHTSLSCNSCDSPSTRPSVQLILMCLCVVQVYCMIQVNCTAGTLFYFKTAYPLTVQTLITC